MSINTGSKENSLHILIYLNSLTSGGAERVVSGLANYWIEHGQRITVVTNAAAARDFYELHPDVVRVASGLDRPSGGFLDAVYCNWRRLNALRTVVRERRPDVAIGMMSSASCTLFLAALGTAVPVVGCLRTYPPREPIGSAWRWARGILFPRFDAIVVQTKRSADWIQSTFAPRKVAVIPNMVNFPLHPALPQDSVPHRGEQANRGKLLLAVGRLRPEKGFDRLIEAFAQLAPSFPDWRLCVLGEGPERPALEHLTARLGLAQRISMPGTVGNVGDWYAAADLYVLTSIFEGFPNSLLEAMAYGLPAVSVDCDTGPRDIVRGDVDGILVPRDDATALVNALRRLMDDEQLRAAYAAKAIEVRQRFSIQNIMRQWQDLLESIIMDRKESSK